MDQLNRLTNAEERGQPGSIPWHAQTAGATVAAFQPRSEGLSPAEVQRRLERHGYNRMPEGVRRSAFTRFFAHFNNVLIYVLFAAATVTALLGHWVDTLLVLEGGKRLWGDAGLRKPAFERH
jgi:magnesium-transporting ATPase (P-type)